MNIRLIFSGLVTAAALCAMPGTTTGAQIFETNRGTTSENGTIGEYTTSGATVNAALVSGLNDPLGIAVSGGNLFVGNAGNCTIGEYTTSGTTVNVALVSGLNQPSGIAVSGGNLFVTNGPGTIGEYNATTGATVNASLISGLNRPVGIAVVSASVPDASSTWALLLLGLTATFGLKPLLRRPA